MKKPVIRQECRYFCFDRPCRFHKLEGVTCLDCKYYCGTEKNILIIKLDALGDVLRTMSLLPSLKDKYPDAKITWITRQNAIPLFHNVPLVDEVLDYYDPQTDHLLRTIKFDLVINPDTNKAALLLASIADGKQKIGFYLDNSEKIVASDSKALSWFLMGINDRLKKENTKTYQEVISGMLGLGTGNRDIPLALDHSETEKAAEFRKTNRLNRSVPVIGLNIGAGARWPNKSWPLEHYKKLIRLLMRNRYKILLLGGPEEKQKMSVLEREFKSEVLSGGCNNSLRDFFYKISVCDLIVSSDTMAVHAALALMKKVVVLFGPTSLNEVEVYGRGIKISADMECLVCYRSKCDMKPSCMDLLKPEMVTDAIQKLI